MARWSWSTDDSHIFRTSALGRQLEERAGHGLAKGVLLGDSGYASLPFLLNLYSQPQSQSEGQFNCTTDKPDV